MESKYFPEEKIKIVRSGESAGKVLFPPHPVQRSGISWFMKVINRYRSEKKCLSHSASIFPWFFHLKMRRNEASEKEMRIQIFLTLLADRTFFIGLLNDTHAYETLSEVETPIFKAKISAPQVGKRNFLLKIVLFEFVFRFVVYCSLYFLSVSQEI